jgi:predicted ATPase
MDLSDLMRQLDERLLHLGSSRHVTTERHRSLASVVDWSYQLLDDDGKKLAAGLDQRPILRSRSATPLFR